MKALPVSRDGTVIRIMTAARFRSLQPDEREGAAWGLTMNCSAHEVRCATGDVAGAIAKTRNVIPIVYDLPRIRDGREVQLNKVI